VQEATKAYKGTTHKNNTDTQENTTQKLQYKLQKQTKQQISLFHLFLEQERDEKAAHTNSDSYPTTFFGVKLHKKMKKYLAEIIALTHEWEVFYSHHLMPSIQKLNYSIRKLTRIDL